ncbi:Xaa-Pro dipeptidase, partial [Trichostrongylus colubriformis]
GPEYNCYASDITTSFPANGKFTEKQKMVYNAVLEANQAVFKAAKPGVRWTDMHMLAEKVILTHLKKAGILTGLQHTIYMEFYFQQFIIVCKWLTISGDIDEMVNARLGAVFMPHGLGHFIGLDVHDCGGYLGDALPRSKLPGLKSLRTTRTLKERMVITIEPGCYFIDTLLDAAFKDPKLAKFLVKAEIDKYRGQGGVCCRLHAKSSLWKCNEQFRTWSPLLKMSFSRGNNTLTVSVELFVENRTRLVTALRKIAPGSVVLLQGGIEKNRYNTDAEDLPFRQESYFFWSFGVHESDFFGAIDVDSGKSCLFPPILDPSYAIWDGKIHTESFFKEKYKVDEVHFLNEKAISNFLERLKAKKVLLLRAENTDSGNVLEPPEFPGKESFNVDVNTLYPVLAELRVFKTDRELEVMRYASKIASEAHRAAMKAVRAGLYEYQMESLFRHTSYYHGGCRHLAYTCIAASGCNSSILHYGHANAPNDKQIKDGDMCLFDMGPEYNCYASDVTTSFPANGKFTEKQKIVYNAVLEANQAVFKAAKPGVRWTDMHLLSEKVILTHLKKAGLVTGDIEEMVNARVGAVFMPHGLGHLIGLDVHDCGGYLGDALPRSELPGLKSLRTTRTLKERMVITIEPGCYFIDTLLDAAFKDPKLAKFLVKSEIDKYRGQGGVRIEDDVVIWEKGNENMSDVPRTVEEIENFMTSGEFNDKTVQQSICNYLNNHNHLNHNH